MKRSKGMYCCLCNRHSFRGIYKKYQFTEFILCPYCKSTNNERFIYSCLKKIQIENPRILYIKNKPFYKTLLKTIEREYNLATYDFDSMESIDRQLINSLPYPHKSFDFVIADYFLEKIPNDSFFCGELTRIVSESGVVFVNSSIDKSRHITRNNSVENLDDRMQLFGISDNYRIYGNDFVSRMLSFKIRVSKIFYREGGVNFDHYIYQKNNIVLKVDDYNDFKPLFTFASILNPIIVTKFIFQMLYVMILGMIESRIVNRVGNPILSLILHTFTYNTIFALGWLITMFIPGFGIILGVPIMTVVLFFIFDKITDTKYSIYTRFLFISLVIMSVFLTLGYYIYVFKYTYGFIFSTWVYDLNQLPPRLPS
ncbi:MAG: hypothetical protein JXR48_19320 [Candidatus Delongbacteria bacterium]|nr:hypothetical protein [Candidatus Delongbacteria bacterium]MBN2837113.1 hypothetical protein [Candidatus Delongbacteria bacterium]